MAWLRNLFIGMLVVVGLLALATSASASETCTSLEYQQGTCSVSGEVGDDEVTVGVDVEVPGTPGGGSGTPGGSGETGPPAPPADPPAEECEGASTPEGCRDTYGATDPVTLDDIAHFRPNPGRNLMQPDGWMIVGHHTNFYAHANRHVIAGELLGQPATVRFTPVGYRWWYGDGSTHYSTNPGNTWHILGLTEFDPTPNSHIYQAPGTYYIDLSVVFRAEYRYTGSDYIPLAGTLTVPANRLVAVAGDAVTVLVERDCTRNPTGPGC